MNLLPFVIVIIMVLSLFSLNQFQGAITQKKENQLYLAYFHGLRETRNKQEKDAYKKSLVKKKTDQNESTEKKPYHHQYFRVKRVGWEKGRLNLSSLLKKPPKYEALESLAESYVKQLYGHASFFPKEKNFAKTLIQSLINIYKENENPPKFYEITFDDPIIQEAFFKMVHGTHTYDLDKKLGYPPFGEMFTFDPSDRAPMNFHYANLSFLSLTFGEKIKSELVNAEQELLPSAKQKCLSPLKKQDIENLLLHKTIGNSETILSLFDFKYQTSKKEPKHYVDENTAITVKIH